jgi:hypothetical protein
MASRGCKEIIGPIHISDPLYSPSFAYLCLSSIMLYRLHIIFLLAGFAKLTAQIPRIEKWDHPAVKYNKVSIPSFFENNDAVIVKDDSNFDLSDFSLKTLTRTVLIKILTEKGLQDISSVSLPESFDIADNQELKQQGRAAKIKIPFIHSFHILYFSARIIKPSGKVIDLKPKDTYSKVQRIQADGEFINDECITFSFEDLQVNDLLEYTYKVEYKPNYGSDMVYLSGKLPKMNCDYRFKYFSLPKAKYSRYIITENISDSAITLEPEEYDKELTYITEHISLKNVEKVNYFIHAMSAKQLPHAFFNLNYIIRLVKARKYSLAALTGFNWSEYTMDKDETKWNTKTQEDTRVFLKRIPTEDNDSLHLKFMKALSDTLNTYKYMSANYMFYNDPRLHALYSTDHLLKRRLSQIFLFKLYVEILNEKGIFFYIGNVQDKRLGEHSPLIRNGVYENIIFAIPNKRSYVYLIPRYYGLTFFLNELPYYYEGAVVALFPVNYEKREGDTLGNHFRFIKTYAGSENENIRIENAVVKVITDSSKCYLDIKESLSGQFSTLLRPFYFNKLIDSTVNPIYFKKCVDKPGALRKNWLLKTGSEEYPFKHIFNCSATVPLPEKNSINFEGWFSFPFNKVLIPEKPTHDFYFDFEYSDVYNFVLKFDTPVTLKNAEEFSRTIENDYFDLSSSIKVQEDSYLLTVISRVKNKVLPKEQADKLMEFVKTLDEINKFKLLYSK